jgi:hypothetical protein
VLAIGLAFATRILGLSVRTAILGFDRHFPSPTLALSADRTGAPLGLPSDRQADPERHCTRATASDSI